MDGYLPAWIITLITLAGSTAITTIVGLLIKSYFKRYMARKEREEKETAKKAAELKRLQDEKKRQERKEEVLVAFREEVSPVLTRLDKIAEVMGLNVEGTVTLLREDLKHARDQFVNKGYCSAAEDASWHELYNVYKKLGGNHFKEWVNAWKEDVEHLPRELPKKKTVTKRSKKVILNESK